MLMRLFSHQNKEKHLKCLETKFYRPEIKMVSFLIRRFFSFAPPLSPYSDVSNWNFPKIGNEFKCLMHTKMLK